MKQSVIRKAMLKFLIAFSVCSSLIVGPASSNEIKKLMEELSGMKTQQMQELEEDDVENELPIVNGKRITIDK